MSGQGFRERPRATAGAVIAAHGLNRLRTTGAAFSIRQPPGAVSAAITRIGAMTAFDPDTETLLRRADEALRNLRAGRGCDVVARPPKATGEEIGIGGDGTVSYVAGEKMKPKPSEPTHPNYVEGQVELIREEGKDGKPYAVRKVYDGFMVTFVDSSAFKGYEPTKDVPSNAIDRFRTDVRNAMATDEQLRCFVIAHAREMGI